MTIISRACSAAIAAAFFLSAAGAGAQTTAEPSLDAGAAAAAAPAPDAAAAALTPEAPAADPTAPAAKVNGVVITRGEFDRNWAFFVSRSGLPPGHADKEGRVNEFRAQVLERLVDEELLFQEAGKNQMLVGAEEVEAEITKAREQFEAPEEFAAALAKNRLTEERLREIFRRNMSIQRFVEKVIAAGVTVSDAEVHEFYGGENRQSFDLPEEVHARHILVSVGEEDTPAVKEEKRRKAEGLLAQLKQGADFEELARKNSDCPTAPEGGDLGFFARGQMDPAFEDVAFALQPGELSGVVETLYGFHVIRVEEKKAAGVIPEAEAAPQIREYLTGRKTEAAVEARLKALRAAAKIESLLAL